MRPISKLILHCSASLEGVNLSGNDIKCMHTNPVRLGGRGWRNPGYHYVVRLDGTVEKILDEQYVSNGVKGHNAESINICYIGGLRKGPKGTYAANTMTAKQREKVVALLSLLHERYPQAKLYGHNDLAAKACPCFRVAEEFPELADMLPSK